MTRRDGLTLVEVMVALVMISIICMISGAFFIDSIQTDADSRNRIQAIAASEGWLDRFRAKSLDFTYFATKQSYPYNYDYASDAQITNASDINKQQVNTEWQAYEFDVQANLYRSDPVIWRIDLTTTYRRAGSEEGNVKVSTLVRQ